jgi:hypothetical protein
VIVVVVFVSITIMIIIIIIIIIIIVWWSEQLPGNVLTLTKYLSWGETSPLCTAAPVWPIVPAPDER